MKKAEIKKGGLYTARVNGRYVTVRVDDIRVRSGYGSVKDTTVYDVTNLTTKRKTTFRSAAKFRSEVVATAKDKPNMPTPLDAELSGQDYIEETDLDTPILDEDGNEVDDEKGENSSDPTRSSLTTSCLPLVTTADQTLCEERNTGRTVFGNLAARIAQANAIAAVNLTPEQEDILATSREIEAQRNNGQRVMVIGAGAGTGKTFTLKQLEQVLGGNGQYTAFNKSLVEDSRSKFKRAAVSTTHALAFREVGKRFSHRLGGQRVKSWQVASALGIEDYYLQCGEPFPVESDAYVQAAVAAGYSEDNQPPDDFRPRTTKRLKSSYLAGQVTEAINRFCQSADRQVGKKHFAWIDGIDLPGDRTNNDKVRDYLLPFVERAWSDLSVEAGTLPFSHDCYVKIWQLGQGPDRPVIAADYILLDEYQDTAEVFVDILKQQTHAFLILVGDDNQRIYEWRGAINAGDEYPDAPRRLLSQSFRFGQAVADVANAVLAGLEESTDLVMRGSPGIPSRVCEVAEPRCYLYRTNAGAIGKLMSATEEGKKGHLIGGTAEVVKFCRAALDLQRGQGTTHQELGCFATWAEVQECSKETEGADLRLMVKLIDEFGADRIIRALDNMPSEEDADLILCTAHKSKGREWTTVRMGQDFPTANKLSDSDRRLVYVAATRAQEELDISRCPTFCGGWDKKGGGEDGEGGSEWVPGIKIAYTQPMPTADQLAEYRAGKSVPRIAQESPVPASAQSLALPAPDAAPAIVAQANGAPAGIQVGEFTWANMNGDWLIRGPANQPVGSRVTVRKKDGRTSQEVLKEVKRKIGDLWFYGIR